VPLIGARHRDRLAAALGAIDVTLSRRDISAIEQRYPAPAIAELDSERR
jgi:aryl-alcohol dehydrogenase-like predicted oxidoreductase